MKRISSARERLEPHLPALGGFLVPFALVLGLALESGGYDIVVRSQFAIVVWWVILLSTAVGLVPLIRVTRLGWLMLGILAGFTVWTALATLTWTESTERSVIEMSRSIAILGFLSVLLLLQGRHGVKRSIGGLGAAIAVVAVVAIASRYHPGWFDIGDLPEGFPVARLSYPLGYWNGLALLMAIGLPALAWIATEARNVFFRALSAAFIPLVILTTYMTASRGGIGALVLSAALLLVIYPRRLKLVISLALPLLASVLLIWLLGRYPELRDNLGGAAGQQGVEMTWLTIVVVAVVGLLTWLIQTRVLGSRIRIPEVDPGVTRMVGYVAAGLAAVLVILAIGSGAVADQWGEFKKPVTDDPTVDRLTSISSGERYYNWTTAIDAGRAEPLTGTGPGTFEYLWARNGNGTIFVRDAHSFYLEVFGELGIPGLLLGLALVLVPIGIALTGAVSRAARGRRSLFAVAAAGMSAYAIGAAVDWSWEVTVLFVSFLVYAAAVCGPDAEYRSGRANRPDFRLPLLNSARVGIVAASVVAILVLYVPMHGTNLLRDSQSLYRQGDLEASRAKATDARDFNPWSASAAVQVALLDSQAGDTSAAYEAAREAADLDPYSWKTWLVLARMAERDGQQQAVEEAMEQVNSLNYRYRSGAIR